MKVQELMTKNTVSVGREEPVSAAARLLKRENIGALPVCDDQGRLQGILTDRDITVRCVAAGRDPSKTAIREIMTNGVYTVSPADSVETAMTLMSKAQIRRLPVSENGKLKGILSLADLAQDSHYEMETAAALSDITACIRSRSSAR